MDSVSDLVPAVMSQTDRSTSTMFGLKRHASTSRSSMKLVVRVNGVKYRRTIERWKSMGQSVNVSHDL